MHRIPKKLRRTIIAISGLVVVLSGLVMVPYPGPGWLVVFGGLTILATEFEFAGKLLDRLQSYYNSWTEWLKNQSVIIRIIVMALTGLVIIGTIWLVNGFGIINDVFRLKIEWLKSPVI